MPAPAIAVFTANSVQEILETGGSASWVMSEPRGKRQRYLVCVRNAKTAGADASEPHSAAFLIGVISGLKQDGFDRKGVHRWTIMIKEYALIEKPGVWKEWRNPVRYTTLEELGISLAGLQFVPMPKVETRREAPSTGARPLTLAEAKEGLALALGVSPDAIEIVIRA
jgi:hypothetical protein